MIKDILIRAKDKAVKRLPDQVNSADNIEETGGGAIALPRHSRKEFPAASIDFLTSIHILVITTAAAGPWLQAGISLTAIHSIQNG